MSDSYPYGSTCQLCNGKIAQLEHKQNEIDKNSAVLTTEFHHVRENLAEIAKSLKDIANVSGNIDLLKSEFKHLGENITASFSRIHQRIDTIEEAQKNLENKLGDTIDKKISTLKESDKRVIDWFDWVLKGAIGGLASIIVAGAAFVLSHYIK